MTLLRSTLILAVAVGSTACGDLFKNLLDSPTSPSETTEIRSYLGTWKGPALAASGQGCSGQQWTITSQDGAQIGGEFSASCADGSTLAGTVTATHGATTIPWSASGTATKGDATCPFTLSGTGTFQGTSNILVNYSGSSCNGPIAGTETIRR